MPAATPALQWRPGDIASIALIAILLTVPIAGSAVMERGYVVAKLALALPLALLALTMVLVERTGQPRLPHDFATRIGLAAMAGFVCVASASAFMSDEPWAAVYGTQFRREGVLAWLAIAGVFIATTLCARRTGCGMALVDAFLFGSVVPVAYAVQQRLGLDFFFVSNFDPNRVNGTLGNPNFLGAYLALAIPLAIARAAGTGMAMRSRLPWAVLAAAQLVALALTQSRGPILSLAMALFVCAALQAFGRGSRRWTLVLAGLPSLLIGAIALANMSDAGRSVASALPFADRLIFDLRADAPVQTHAASRSVVTRLGMWEAGNATLAETSLAQRLLGFGPDLAYTRVYAHIPPSVMRMEGYWAVTNYDRLHADVLDIALNFGFLGWFAYWLIFTLALRNAARAMFLSARIDSVIVWAIASLGGAVALGAVVHLWHPQAAAAAFGMGAAVGWLACLGRSAWRAARSGAASAQAQIHGGVNAGAIPAALVAALLAHWLDAQINVPVLATRLIAFTLAGLALAHLGEPSPRGTGEAERESWFGAGIALACITCCASFIVGLAGEVQPGLAESLRPALPVAVLLGFALWADRVGAVSSSARASGSTVAWIAGVGVYTLAHFLLRVDWSARLEAGAAQRLFWISLLPALAVPGLCLLAGLRRVEHALSPSQSSAGNGATRLRWIICLAGAGLIAVSLQLLSRLVDAEVSLYASSLSADERPAAAAGLREHAVAVMPHEREYHRRRVFGRFVVAVDRLKRWQHGVDGARLIEEIDAAAFAGRAAVERFPRDPWVLLALANVYQARGLAALRDLDPAGSDAAVAEARALLLRAQEQFPAQPQVYRNRANLEFDQGNLDLAVRLVDAMEELIPGEAEPYIERILMAQRLGDIAEIEKTLARATRHLQPPSLEAVKRVAKMQQ